MTVSFVVPCFNESEGIVHLAAKLESAAQRLQNDFKVEVIFVDDGSQDGTADLLESSFSVNGDLPMRVIRHSVNQGVGAAQRNGFQAARGDFVVTMDSDCTYDPIEIAEMLRLMTDGTDVVAASPYHPQGRVSNVPRYRLFLSRNLSRIYNWILRQNLHTYTSLFRIYRREVVQEVQFQADGFLSMAEILIGAIRRGYRVKEFPTELRLRQYGTSKIKIMRAILDHLRFITTLLFEKFMGRL